MLRVTGPDDNIVKEYAQKVRTVMAQNPAVTHDAFRLDGAKRSC